MCVSEDTCRRQVWRRHASSRRHVCVRRHVLKTGRAQTRVVAKTHGRAKTLPDDRSGEETRKQPSLTQPCEVWAGWQSSSLWRALTFYYWSFPTTDIMIAKASDALLVPDGAARARACNFRQVRPHTASAANLAGFALARTRAQLTVFTLDVASGTRRCVHWREAFLRTSELR